MHPSSFITALVLSNILLCVAFRVHSVLADVSFLSHSHTSAELGKNLSKNE